MQSHYALIRRDKRHAWSRLIPHYGVGFFALASLDPFDATRYPLGRLSPQEIEQMKADDLIRIVDAAEARRLIGRADRPHRSPRRSLAKSPAEALHVYMGARLRACGHEVDHYRFASGVLRQDVCSFGALSRRELDRVRAAFDAAYPLVPVEVV